MNKKILKSIFLTSCGLGITSLIPITTTSCKKGETTQQLQVTYNHIHYKGDYKIDGFSGDEYGIDLPENQLNGTNLISVNLFNKLTQETSEIDINDVKFTVINLDSKKIIKWISIKPISIDPSKARIYWNSKNVNEGTYRFCIKAEYRGLKTIIDNNFQLNLAAPDSAKIRLSFNSDNYYNTKVNEGTTLPDKISFNSKSLQPVNIQWKIEEIIGPNALNHEQIFCNWISIDQYGQITISPPPENNQKIANNNYVFRIYATNGSDLTSTSNYIYLQVSVDWKINYVSKCYLNYSSNTLNGFDQWYIDNASIFLFDTLCIPTDVSAIADFAFNGLLRMPVGINSLLFLDDGINDTREITIGKFAFAHNFYLNNVHIPKYIKEIGEHAFAQTSLQNIDFDNTNPYFSYSTELVNDYEKNQCKAIYLKNQDFSSGSLVGNLICCCPCINLAQKGISEQYFMDCYGLTGLILLNTTYKIENHAFFRCINLSKITWRDVGSTDGLNIDKYSFLGIASPGLLIAGNKYCSCDQIYSKLVDFSSFPSNWQTQNEQK